MSRVVTVEDVVVVSVATVVKAAKDGTRTMRCYATYKGSISRAYALSRSAMIEKVRGSCETETDIVIALSLENRTATWRLETYLDGLDRQRNPDEQERWEVRAMAFRAQRGLWEDSLTFGTVDDVTWEISESPAQALLPGID